jgi:hypothetical protein
VWGAVGFVRALVTRRQVSSLLSQIDWLTSVASHSSVRVATQGERLQIEGEGVLIEEVGPEPARRPEESGRGAHECAPTKGPGGFPIAISSFKRPSPSSIVFPEWPRTLRCRVATQGERPP